MSEYTKMHMTVNSRRAHITILLLFILILGGHNISFGQQERNKLEADKKKIEEEIQYTSELLSQTSKSRESSLNELIILKNQIRKREALIEAINREINQLNKEIEIKEDSIAELDKELRRLKDEYAKMIYFAFKNRNVYDRLMFIFASEDFNQAYRRLKYFQQYSAYRKMQSNLIMETQDKLTEKKAELENQRSDKEILLDEQKTAFAELVSSKDKQNQTVIVLSKKEKELKKELKEKEKARDNLEKAIKEIIAEEIRLAAERAKRESSMKAGDEMSLTPAELKLSNDFASNRGKLPWPSDRGVVSSTFGEQPHPVLSKVKIKNNGIDILTSEGSVAKSIFEGEVTRVMNVPNFNNVVIVRHGEFLTVYSNLAEIYVKKGDMIKTMQAIGTIHTDRNKGKTELHFEIWKAKTLQDPMLWLMKR